MYPFHIACIKATELVEKRAIAGLSLLEGLKLHLHTAMCAACRAYESQSVIIDSMLEQGPDSSRPERSSDEINELSSKILKNLPK